MTDLSALVADLTRLQAAAQPTPGVFMDDGGPHYSNEALVAKYQLMAASRNALPHLLAERELLVAVAEAARYAVPVSCCDTDICDTSRADTDGCQGSVSGKCARVEALQALARLDSEETP